MRYLIALVMMMHVLFADPQGILAVGVGYKEELYHYQADGPALGIIAIVRDELYSLEGNRLSMGLAQLGTMHIASVTRIQEGLLDTGLQFTLPLAADLRFQMNTLFNVMQDGAAVEAMLYRRFTLGNLEMIPSVAYEYVSSRYLDASFEVHEEAVHFEAELLSIYRLSKKYAILNTIFYNHYDAKVLQNSRIDDRDTYRTTLALGYYF